MKRIGITGGIGSGKSAVCKIFERLGVAVYYADERAKALMTNAPELREGILSLFGEQAYGAEGLNRAYIAKRAFADNELLKSLNALVHPAVGRDFEDWSRAQKGNYILKEAALLVETGSYLELDGLIVVSAPEELRIERVMSRDGVDREAVLARIRKQLPESEKLALADHTIVNDGSRSLIRQVLQLDDLLSAASSV